MKLGPQSGQPIDVSGHLPALERHINRTDSCWLWTGTRTSNDERGYGRVHLARSVLAHRAVYTALIGAIPEGMSLDHLCRVRLCVNPDHLEVVTHLENVRRGSIATATHCKRGHEFTPENTRRQMGGSRACKTCQQAISREGKRRRRAGLVCAP